MSHFFGEFGNLGSPGSRLPRGTIGPAEEGCLGPCTQGLPPVPQRLGRPVTSEQKMTGLTKAKIWTRL